MAVRRIVVPARELKATYGLSPDQIERMIRDQFRAYRATLRDDQRRLLERFQFVDMARKVVGVGASAPEPSSSCSRAATSRTRCSCRSRRPPPPSLEGYLPKSRYQQHGERVVCGQRMLQAASDIFLGWTRGREADRYFYWRQLRDMKGSADVEAMAPVGLRVYAGICGWTLARAHARSGDPITIAEYLGEDDQFDRSITDFAERYAEQNERDYDAFTKAVRSGRLEALEGI